MSQGGAFRATRLSCSSSCSCSSNCRRILVGSAAVETGTGIGRGAPAGGRGSGIGRGAAVVCGAAAGCGATAGRGAATGSGAVGLRTTGCGTAGEAGCCTGCGEMGCGATGCNGTGCGCAIGAPFGLARGTGRSGTGLFPAGVGPVVGIGAALLRCGGSGSAIGRVFLRLRRTVREWRRPDAAACHSGRKCYVGGLSVERPPSVLSVASAAASAKQADSLKHRWR